MAILKSSAPAGFGVSVVCSTALVGLDSSIWHLSEPTIPDDPQYLIALGRLTAAHGNLEWIQLMCLKTLDGLGAAEVLERYRGERAGFAGAVRDKIKRAMSARTLHGRESERDAVCELVDHAGKLSDRRNALLHRYYGKRLDGVWESSGDASEWGPIPDSATIDALSQEIVSATETLNRLRFDQGYILGVAAL